MPRKLLFAILAIVVFSGLAYAIPARGVANPLYHQLYVPENDATPRIVTYNLSYTDDRSRQGEITRITNIVEDWVPAAGGALSLPAGSKSYGLAVSENGSNLFVTIASPAAIRVYPLTNGLPNPATYTTLSWTVPAGSSLGEIAVIGSRLFVVNIGANQVEYFNLSGSTWSHGGSFLSGTAGLFGITATADKVFVSQKTNAGKVFVYSNAAAPALLQTFTGLKNPTYLKVSPLEPKVYIVVNDSLVAPDAKNVLVYRTDTYAPVGTVKTLTTADNGPYGWSGLDLSPADDVNPEYLYFSKKDSTTATQLYRIQTSAINGTVYAETAVTGYPGPGGTDASTIVSHDSFVICPNRYLIGFILSDSGSTTVRRSKFAHVKPVVDSITPSAMKHPLGTLVPVTITGRNFANSPVVQSLPQYNNYYESIKNIVIKSPTTIEGAVDGKRTHPISGAIGVNEVNLYDLTVVDATAAADEFNPTGVKTDAFTLNLPEPVSFEGNNPAYGIVEDGLVRWSFDWLGVGETSYTLLHPTNDSTSYDSTIAASGTYPGKGIINAGDTSNPNTLISRRLKIAKVSPDFTGSEITDVALTVYTSCQKPTALTSSQTHNTVTLSWEAGGNPADTTYEIERISPTAATYTATAPTFTDTNLTPLTEYQYRVRAVNKAGYPTTWTAPISVTTDFAPGTAPTSTVSVDANYYGPNTLNAGGVATIHGTASATQYGIQITHVRIRRTDNGRYWSGSNSWQTAIAWLNVGSSTDWSYSNYTGSAVNQPTNNISIEVDSRTTDTQGNIQTVYGHDSFIWDKEGPKKPADQEITFTAPTLAAPNLVVNWPVFLDDESGLHETETYYYYLQLSGAPLLTPAQIVANPQTVITTANTATLSGLANGQYRFYVIAKDKVLNVSQISYYSELITVNLNSAPGAFNLLYPQNNTAAAPTPTFDWTKADDLDADTGDIVTYNLTINQGATTVFTKTGITSHYYPLLPTDITLTTGQTYSWSVTAVDSFDATTASTQTWNFTVEADVPGNPSIVSTIPANQQEDVPVDAPVKVFFSEAMDQATVTKTTPAWTNGWITTWSADSKTVTYTHNNFDGATWYPFSINGGKDFASPGNNLTNVPYIWNFQTNSDGTINQAPNSPELNLPDDGAETSVTPTLSWTPAIPVDPNDPTVSYRVEILSGEAIIHVSPLQTGTSYSIPGGVLSLGNTYQWRVIAVDQWGAETVSTPESRTFTAAVLSGASTYNFTYQSETQSDNWFSVPYTSAQVAGAPINTIGDLMGSLGNSFTSLAGDLITLSWYNNNSQTPVSIQRDFDGSSWNIWDADTEALPISTGRMYIFTVSNPGRPAFSASWNVSGVIPEVGTVTFPLAYLSEDQAENWISVPNIPGLTTKGNLMTSIAGAFTNQAGDLMTLTWYDNVAQVPVSIQRDFDGAAWNPWDAVTEGQSTSLGDTYKVTISNPGRGTFNVIWP